MGGPKVDKSAPSPFYLLYGSRSSQSSSVPADKTTTSKENKGRGEKQPTGLFAWLVILSQTQGPDDDWPGPLDLPKQQEVGPFSLLLLALFFLLAVSWSQDMQGVKQFLNIWDLHQKRVPAWL